MTKFLNEFSSKNILKEFGLPTGDFFLATSEEEVVKYSKDLGYPIVLKIVSDQIIHKTEAKGIKLDLKTEKEVIEAYRRLLINAKEYDDKAIIDGVLVSKMVSKGIEIIIGGLRDVQFGPVVMFGLGGVFVEIFKDVQFRMAPITKTEALDLIKSIEAFPMLKGFRGMEPVNLENLAEVLVKIGNLIYEDKTISEVDVNPLICIGDNIQILDAAIGIKD